MAKNLPEYQRKSEMPFIEDQHSISFNKRDGD